MRKTKDSKSSEYLSGVGQSALAELYEEIGWEPTFRRAWILSRLGSLRKEQACSTIDSLLSICRSDRRLREQVISRLVVPETHFFRSAPNLTYAIGELSKLPHAVRVWSAGCASGEELYSVAASLKRGGIVPSLLLGTDVSAEAIRSAQRGTYGVWSLRGTDPSLCTDFLKPQGHTYRVREAHRSKTRFIRHNLLDSRVPGGGAFDVTFCQNVLLYMSAPSRRLVWKNLVAATRVGGLILTSSADPAPDPSLDLQPIRSGQVRGYLVGATDRQHGLPSPDLYSGADSRPAPGRRLADVLAECRLSAQRIRELGARSRVA
ncbi:MAG: hypothetical protein KC561_15150, partial [Myxococcales bacterium]|nr:hypothetical protein [Myxococcales bacterium]